MYYSPHVGAPAHTTTYVASRFPSNVRKKVSVKELLEWAYRDQMVHVACPEGVDPSLTREYSPGPVEWRVERVDSSAKYQLPAAHDAYRVHEAVTALGGEPLIVPAWLPPPHTPDLARGALPERPALKTSSRSELVKVSALRGPPELPEAEIEVHRKGIVYEMIGGKYRLDRRNQRIPLLCIVEFGGDLPWIVAHQRFLYDAWAAALAELRESLAGLLTVHSLTDGLPRRLPNKSA